MVTTLTSDTFEKDVTQSKGVVFVDFFAEWCGPCKVTSPIIEALSEDPAFKDITFYELDVDQSPEVSGNYNIFSIPTFIIFKDGKPVSQFVGARDKSGFEQEIKKAMQ